MAAQVLTAFREAVALIGPLIEHAVPMVDIKSGAFCGIDFFENLDTLAAGGFARLKLGLFHILRNGGRRFA